MLTPFLIKKPNCGGSHNVFKYKYIIFIKRYLFGTFHLENRPILDNLGGNSMDVLMYRSSANLKLYAGWMD